ncbi:MAG TPA: post-transcriptional regulator [Bacillota bacterium]|nr:post-transcriptional regulator [Bacillota bacterium]
MHASLYTLKQQVKMVCESKAEEFHLLGYEQVSAEEIWECIVSSYKKEVPALHQIVGDIYSLRVTKFMNWLTMRIYQGDFN